MIKRVGWPGRGGSRPRSPFAGRPSTPWPCAWWGLAGPGGLAICTAAASARIYRKAMRSLSGAPPHAYTSTGVVWGESSKHVTILGLNGTFA